MSEGNAGYVESAKGGIIEWLESVRYRDEGWGRWKYHAAMTRPWALQASGIAVLMLDQLGALGSVSEEQKAEAIEFFQSCQDRDDRLLKDPLETEADHEGEHTWEQIWGQRNGSALSALEVLGGKPRFSQVSAQFADLEKVDGREWTLSLDWSNPWRHGESWSRAIEAFLATKPSDERSDSIEVLAGAFDAMESEILDPSSGMPTVRGCGDDLPRAMAGIFKIMVAYLAVGRDVPNAERVIDSTLALQHENGEFGYRGNMCMNWDALWVLYKLDKQLEGGYRHADIVASGNRTSETLMSEYRKSDGGFAFCGGHCLAIHHSIRLCDKAQPISDMLGTRMSLHCLSYTDEWNS